MFGFNKDKSKQNSEQPEASAQPEGNEEKRGLFGRIRQGLTRTREVLTTDVRDLIAIKRVIDDEVLEELETQLLLADIGVEATQAIIAELTARASRNELGDADALFAALRELIVAILEPVALPLEPPAECKPFTILMVGINGAGKTTTIGKLARRFQDQGRSVILAAGDTFRAAAVEQLQTWGERNDIPVIAQQSGADSASVIFDGVESATARGVDVLIADTAGRLHTQDNLMEELKKIKRVMGKRNVDAPHEVLLVVDAGTGQNALNQAEQFHKAIGLTGIALTKLDGTAKGGIVVAIAKRLGLPIRFIGVGEGIEDLRPFDPNEFVDALLDQSGE